MDQFKQIILEDMVAVTDTLDSIEKVIKVIVTEQIAPQIYIQYKHELLGKVQKYMSRGRAIVWYKRIYLSYIGSINEQV